ncbi:hypothetical protein D3C76_1587090 [compost metagenome]
MAEVILLMALEAHQIRLKHRETKRTAADQGKIGMHQTTAIACQTMRQPIIRLMQHKGQTLRMRHFNVKHAIKQAS